MPVTTTHTITSGDPFSIEVPNSYVAGGVIFANLATPAGQAEDAPVVVSVSGAYPNACNLALVNATAGTVVLTLPPGSAAILGRRYSIIKTDNSANVARLVPQGSDTIENASNVEASYRYARRDVVWAGDMWRRAEAVLSDVNYLKAYNDLTDVANPKVARQAIGANDHLVQGSIANIAAGTVARCPWPYAASEGNSYLIRMDVVLNGATDGTAIFTASIGGTSATPALTIPLGVAGDRGSVLLTDGNSIPADSVINVTPSGTNTLAVGASFTIRAII